MKELNGKPSHDLRVKSIFVRDYEKYKDLKELYNVTLYTDLEEFAASGVDVIVEAANVQAAKHLLPHVITYAPVVAISIGAFRDVDFYEEMERLSIQYKKKVHLPSGAIGGLDLLQNANVLGSVKKVTLVTSKPTSSLVNRPIATEEVIFEGSAGEAIRDFPKNINVSILLSLAGVGMDETKV